MEFVLAALPGVVTSCLLAYVLRFTLDRHSEERQAHRIEIDQRAEAHSSQVSALLALHTEQMAKSSEAHRREIADLCQRIQAPQVAVQEHAGRYAGPDPLQPDLDDDEVLAEIKRREEDMFRLAEELAAER